MRYGKISLRAWAVVAAAAVAAATTAWAADPPRHAVRLELKKAAAGKFAASTNHCGTFGDIVEIAVGKAGSVADLLEDLKLVLIGEDWLRRPGKRGPYYMDVKTGDSGFKPELKDGSPQVEHAMAGIYLAKVLPPGGVGAKGSFLEFLTAVGRKEKPSSADMLLYAYGEDLGGRVMASNMKDLPGALRKTLCR